MGNPVESAIDEITALVAARRGGSRSRVRPLAVAHPTPSEARRVSDFLKEYSGHPSYLATFQEYQNLAQEMRAAFPAADGIDSAAIFRKFREAKIALDHLSGELFSRQLAEARTLRALLKPFLPEHGGDLNTIHLDYAAAARAPDRPTRARKPQPAAAASSATVVVERELPQMSFMLSHVDDEKARRITETEFPQFAMDLPHVQKLLSVAYRLCPDAGGRIDLAKLSALAHSKLHVDDAVAVRNLSRTITEKGVTAGYYNFLMQNHSPVQFDPVPVLEKLRSLLR